MGEYMGARLPAQGVTYIWANNMKLLELFLPFLGAALLSVTEGSASCDGCNCPLTIRLNPAKASNTTVITSPSFPNKYPKNQNCKWIINATKGKLSLTFDKFKTEWSHNCRKDYLFVANVAKYNKLYLCGSNIPSNLSLKSKARTIVLKFQSNNKVGKPGFKARVVASGLPVTKDSKRKSI